MQETRLHPWFYKKCKVLISVCILTCPKIALHSNNYKSVQVMIRRERKFYSEEFRERVLTAYYNSNESVDMIARRFQVKRDTVSSWVHRKRVASNPKESSKFVVSSIIPMKEEKLPIEAMEERIRELEQQLAKEKMRSTCLDTMIDIAERELKVDIRKNLVPNSPRSKAKASII